MRYFQKVMRRADVDIRYSEGFSPHQIMSFASPLGVGILSNGEYVDIEVNSTKDSKTMIEQINRENAEGFCVLSYRKLDDSVKNAMSQVAAADYTMWFREGYEPEDVPRFMKNLLAFCHSDKIEIVKKTKKGQRRWICAPASMRSGSRMIIPGFYESFLGKHGQCKAGTGCRRLL